MKKILYLLLIAFLLVIPNSVYALNEVNVYFFHKKTCDICEQERIYLQALKDRYPNMRIYSYEVSDEHNYELMQQARNIFNDTRTGVPYTVIADTPYHGFSQGIKGNFQRSVYLASTNKYENKVGQMLNLTYKDDLEGEVQEYKENSDYVIEEKGEGYHPTYTETSSTFKKYKASIILIGSGLILLVIYLILKIVERRRSY